MFAVNRRRNDNSTKSGTNSSTNSLALSKPKSSTKVGSKPTTIELRGIPVHFPFTPYPCQTDYMTKVIDALNKSQNALLESPTGTGKTLSLLCAALAWQREQARFLPQNNTSQDVSSSQSNPQNSTATPQRGRVPTILYASRTHSQISQVVKELRSTRYRPKHAVLASREQMCVHERVSKLGNSMQLNHECSKLTKERRCRFRLNTETFTPPGTDPTDPNSPQPVLDMEDLLLMGTKQKVCPFYFTRGQISDADIIFLPYNYLFDREARKTLGAPSSGNTNPSSTTDQNANGKTQSLGINWKNAIVIFDEAHNLESFASESASFDLTGLDIAGCIGEVDRAIGMIGMSTEMSDNKKMEVNMIKLKSIFLQMEQYVDNKIPARGGSYRGDYIFEIWKEGAHLNFQNHEIFISFVKQVSDVFMEIRGAAGTPKLDHFVSCLRRTFAGSSEGQCFAKAKAYRVHVTPVKGTNSNSTPGQFDYRTLSYWCFAPALSMHELAALGPLRSMLVTSGTLSPLPSYSMELGLPFPVQLENPHIVKPTQVHVRVIGKGVSNKLLKSTYERREKPEYIIELGNTLISLAKIIPGGMLVFFPSYSVMEKCVEGWGGPVRRSHNFSTKDRKKNFFGPKSVSSKRFSFPHAPNFYASNSVSTSLWKRMLMQKAIVLEPKSSADLKPAIEEFDKFLSCDGSSGCILMGVCRGKISEGIDFADHRARAVIITGLPFAPFHDPKVKLKREFLDGVKMEKRIKPSDEGGFKTHGDNNHEGDHKEDAETISGTEWYSQQAHRAVNQAIGRVIRHRFDYGSVLLLDSRFAEPRNQSGLSKWVRPYILPDEGCGKAISGLAKFYRNAERDPYLATKGGKKIELKYEDDDVNEKEMMIEDTNMIETVAIIETSPQKGITKEGNTKTQNKQDAVATSGYVRAERIIRTYNINDTWQREENVSSYKKTEGSKVAQKTTERDQSQGISVLYRKRNHNAAKFSSGILAATKGNDMTTTIASAWAGLQKKSSSMPIESTKKHLFSSSTKPKDNGLGTSSRIRNSISSSSTISSMRGKEKVSDNTTAKLLFEAAKNHLSKEHFTSFRTFLVSMRDSGEKKDTRTYLKVASKMVNLLLSYEQVIVKNREGKEICGLLSLLYPLLPKRYLSAVRKITNDITALKRTRAIKIAEKKRAGEKGLDRLIAKRRIMQTSLEESQKIAREKKISSSNPNQEMEQQERIASLLRAEELNKTARKEIQKLQEGIIPVDKTKLKKALRLPTSAQLRTKKKAPLRMMLNQESQVGPIMRKKYLTQDIDAVDKCLHQASMIVPQRNSFKSNLKIRSNTPKNLVCTICDETPEKPHLANCRHTACLKCWVQWLDKLGEGKGTCPVCRVPVKKEDLARMLFKKAGSRTPTLSQICDGDEQDSESEEELEIIK